MLTQRRFGRLTRQCFILIVAVVGLTSCTTKGTSMKTADLTEFATRYAAAWSGKDPVAFGVSLNTVPQPLGAQAVVLPPSEVVP